MDGFKFDKLIQVLLIIIPMTIMRKNFRQLMMKRMKLMMIIIRWMVIKCAEW